MYFFRNDYAEGCHPKVLEALAAVNAEHVVGYGFDQYTRQAADLIRELCAAPQADVQFLVGGTQTNFVTIAAFLRPWESVICTAGGHINTHEAGAVEATGHKLIQVPPTPDGKLTPDQIPPIVKAYEDEHLTKPKLVYISDSTETGGVYTKAELTAISECCKANGLYLFLDGARLGCALVSEPNDMDLTDLARLTDAFYIGGTKNGAMMGEALVICNPELQDGFFRLKKQSGAVLAKGWLLGVQFTALLKDGLYFELAKNSVGLAQVLQSELKAMGIPMMTDSPTNQIFPTVPDALLPKLEAMSLFEVWEKADESHTSIRLVTSFATTREDVDSFLRDVKALL